MEATITAPGGLGPWFCGLFFNTCQKSKKQTHVIAHTQLSWASMHLNKQAKYVQSNVGWVAVMKVGPFSSWQNAVSFVYLWTDKTRGKCPRILQGQQLFKMCAQQFNLRLWVINKTYQQIATQRIKQNADKQKKQSGKKRQREKSNKTSTMQADSFLSIKMQKMAKEHVLVSDLLAR